MPAMTIPEAMRAARGRMTQTQLGDAVGLPQSSISDIERGARAVTVDELVAIERATGRPPGWILRAIGHARTSMTWDTYAHAVGARDQAAADAFDDVVSGAGDGEPEGAGEAHPGERPGGPGVGTGGGEVDPADDGHDHGDAGDGE